MFCYLLIFEARIIIVFVIYRDLHQFISFYSLSLPNKIQISYRLFCIWKHDSNECILIRYIFSFIRLLKYPIPRFLLNFWNIILLDWVGLLIIAWQNVFRAEENVMLDNFWLAVKEIFGSSKWLLSISALCK